MASAPKRVEVVCHQHRDALAQPRRAGSRLASKGATSRRPVATRCASAGAANSSAAAVTTCHGAPHPHAGSVGRARHVDLDAAGPVAGRLTRHDGRLGGDVEFLQHPGDRGRMELAERRWHAVAHAAEDGALDLEGAQRLADGKMGAAAGIGPSDERPRDVERDPPPQGPGQPGRRPASQRGQLTDGPLRRVLARGGRHARVVVAFRAQEAEHRMQRRQPDGAVSKAARVEPVLVELQPVRQSIGDSLVEGGHHQPPDTRVPHFSVRLSGLRRPGTHGRATGPNRTAPPRTRQTAHR